MYITKISFDIADEFNCEVLLAHTDSWDSIVEAMLANEDKRDIEDYEDGLGNLPIYGEDLFSKLTDPHYIAAEVKQLGDFSEDMLKKLDFWQTDTHLHEVSIIGHQGTASFVVANFIYYMITGVKEYE